MDKRKINYQLLVRRICLIILDCICILTASFAALATRFEFLVSEIPEDFLMTLIKYSSVFTLITLMIFGLFRIYSSMWEYAGIEEAINIVWACLLSGAAEFAVLTAMGGFLPRSYYILRTAYLVALVGVTRFSYRTLRLKKQHKRMPWQKSKRVMVVGAGEAGRALIAEIQTSSHIETRVCCVIDDDPAKYGKFIRGVRVVGNVDSIQKNVEKYHVDQIIIAIPSATAEELKPILEICKETECELKTLPGIYQLVNGEVNVSKLRPVSVEDLLGRDEIKVDLGDIMGYVAGKTVLVTGGGGSIGSELCRQIAQYYPKRLLIFDIYENNAYEIQQELRKKYPKLNIEVLIGSVQDIKRVDTVFETYRPELVFHAAAHKHVPLMEDSPNESIKNNVNGTWTVAFAADRYKAQKMVLISTDKAVRPTNIMGASKRICELIVQSFTNLSKTEYVAVRFGNVLGSNGSVIPLFKKQIAEGGPVTVTHPDIIRYFMTIPEAVSLVLQAGAYANGGELFVLDMGKPVKILDLAKNIIRLSGLVEGRDIEIKFTGLRPGEKLFEELLIDETNLKETANNRIFVVQQTEVDALELRGKVKNLIREARNESADIRQLVKEIVPEYKIQREE